MNLTSWATLGLLKQSEGMGFRDFHEFNLALLARQCWRLITKPNHLWANVIKARYFPNEDDLPGLGQALSNEGVLFYKGLDDIL